MKSPFIALLFMVVSLQACYENIEGCLDVNATNFSVTADRECEDCCTYPLLRLAVQHAYSDIEKDTSYRFNLNEVYTLDSISFFAITDLRYYLSEIKLIRENEDRVDIEEKVDIFVLNGTDTVPDNTQDNFALINRSNITPSQIGTFRENGRFVGIEFKFGLSNFDRTIFPQFLERSHPLAFGSDSLMYDLEKESYLVTRFDLARDTLPIENDTTTIQILAKDYFQQVELDFDFQVDVGFNTTIALQVDYRRWLEGVDVKTDLPEEIINKIKANIAETDPSPFEILEVRVAN
ncbi:MAG: MbnP family protein [Bacteroidota bacterium]